MHPGLEDTKMADIMTDLLTGLAAGGRGFLDENRRREAMLEQLRQRKFEEESELANQGLKREMFDRIQIPQATSQIGLDTANMLGTLADTEREGGEFEAEYGDRNVPGGLQRYR